MRKKTTKKAVRKAKYAGVPRTSIRLTDAQKTKIWRKYETIQAFIDEGYKTLFKRKTA